MQLASNQDFTYQDITNDVLVEIKPFYVPEKSAPETEYFFFAYAVKIINLSSETVKLLNRHWIIKDGKGTERFINGEGVVGERPEIAPGDTFEYTSFCPLSTSTGNMRGKYELQTNDGSSFWARVPLIFFRRPDSFLN